ncbi:MAG: hypothetical protein ACREV6_17475 [Clostridium sp.]|uniref:hypothetical protein n=1 Tax=Clostridium sp. TaxID=1506 RepID=UPI003D6D4D6A
MSGIEVIYWVKQYPEEIYNIIGLDMRVPEIYDSNDKSNNISKLGLLGKSNSHHQRLKLNVIYSF